MRPATENVCVDENYHDALVTPCTGFEESDGENGVWMRSCPRCNGLLCKPSRSQTVRCICGWEWKP